MKKVDYVNFFTVYNNTDRHLNFAGITLRLAGNTPDRRSIS